MNKIMVTNRKLLLIIYLVCLFLSINFHAEAELGFTYQGRVTEVTADGNIMVELLGMGRGKEVAKKDIVKISLLNMSYKNYVNELKKGDRIMFTGYLPEVWYIEVFEKAPIEHDTHFDLIVKEINNYWYLFYPRSDNEFLRAPLKNIEEYNISCLGLRNNVKFKKIQTYHTRSYGITNMQYEYIVGSYRNDYAAINPENILYFFDFIKNPIDTPEEVREYILLKEKIKGEARVVINTKEEFEEILASMNKTNKEISINTGIGIWKDLPVDSVLLKESPVYGIKTSAVKDGFIVEALFYDDCISNAALQKITYEKYKVDRNGNVYLAESKDIAIGRGGRALILW